MEATIMLGCQSRLNRELDEALAQGMPVGEPPSLTLSPVATVRKGFP
jgi:hypothetical protein